LLPETQERDLQYTHLTIEFTKTTGYANLYSGSGHFLCL
jgi:hypothetical protein